MSRRPARTIAILAAVVALTPVVANAAAYTVTDTLGRTVSFEREPERIVLAGRATLLLVDAVYLFPGAASRVIGVGATDQGLGDSFPLLDPGPGSRPVFPTRSVPNRWPLRTRTW